LAAAEIALRLLQLGGLEVTRAGVMLMDGPNLVGMDPPCAGIRMLWTSCFVAAVMVARMQLRGPRTLLLLSGALATVVLGNSVRAALVFFPESGRVHWPEWMHPGAGLVVHGLVLAVIYRLAGLMEEGTRHLQTPPGAGWSTRMRPWPIAAFAGAVMVLLCSAFLIEDSWQDTAPLRHTEAPWPATLDGMPLSPVPLTSREERFARAFPGQIAKFRSHDNEVIFRRVTSATRRMHPSGDCLRAAGFTVTGKPVFQDADGRLWGCSIAERNGQNWRVRERFVDSTQSRTCTDASAWFWAAVMHPAEGPWLAITVMEPL
jgi:exosortase/archaeosortase family protein